MNYDKTILEDLYYNLRKSTLSITNYYDLYLSCFGIRSTQFNLLIIISKYQLKSITEISKELSLNRTTLSRNLKNLEKLGLVSENKLSDKRSTKYKLTENGILAIERCSRFFEKAKNEIKNIFGNERYKKLTEELISIQELIKDLTD